VANRSPHASGSDGGAGPAATSSPSYRRERTPERATFGASNTSTMIGIEDNLGEHAIVAEAAIEDGKLIYQKKCYTRGQPVYVETPDSVRTAAVLQTIGVRDLTLRLTNGKRMHFTLQQLQTGKCTLWRRPS